MEYIIKAIRNELISDAMLTSMVSADDIHASYVKEINNYPCVTMSVSAAQDNIGISGIDACIVEIETRARTSKLDAWAIAKRIKALLDNQERNVTDADRRIHVIREINAYDDVYDLYGNVWLVVQRYHVLYSVTSIVATSGATGVIYADATSVSADTNKEIAKFRGSLQLNVAFESEVRQTRNRFGKALLYRFAQASLTIGEVLFKASIMDLLWNINTSVSGYLNDGSTLATTYQVSQSSYPKGIQVLYQATKTDDGKKIEIEAHNAYCNSLRLPFSKSDFTVIDCNWTLLADSNGNVVKTAVEN